MNATNYAGFYFIHQLDIADLSQEELWEEIEEYNRRCEDARQNGYGISTKETVRNNRCRDEVYKRTFGDTPIELVREFFKSK